MQRADAGLVQWYRASLTRKLRFVSNIWRARGLSGDGIPDHWVPCAGPLDVFRNVLMGWGRPKFGNFSFDGLVSPLWMVTHVPSITTPGLLFSSSLLCLLRGVAISTL